MGRAIAAALTVALVAVLWSGAVDEVALVKDLVTGAQEPGR